DTLKGVLDMLLAMNQHQFFRLGGYVDLLDLGPGSPGNGLSLAVPTWGVAEEARIKMLHGTTILAFKALASSMSTVKETGSWGQPSL
uniref:Uncharacterized protein n=1 Tax=Sus scrofa TaxID=9823 RepID=F1S9F7_PIG